MGRGGRAPGPLHCYLQGLVPGQPGAFFLRTGACPGNAPRRWARASPTAPVQVDRPARAAEGRALSVVHRAARGPLGAGPRSGRAALIGSRGGVPCPRRGQGPVAPPVQSLNVDSPGSPVPGPRRRWMRRRVPHRPRRPGFERRRLLELNLSLRVGQVLSDADAIANCQASAAGEGRTRISGGRSRPAVMSSANCDSCGRACTQWRPHCLPSAVRRVVRPHGPCPWRRHASAGLTTTGDGSDL